MSSANENSAPILLVEGNLEEEVRIVRAYQETGRRNRLIVARTTENALTILRACANGIKFKLVFLDFHIPRFGAADFLRRLRRDPKISETPVVLMTPEKISEEDGGELSAAADSWFRKTRDSKSLQKILDHFVDIFTGSKGRENAA